MAEPGKAVKAVLFDIDGTLVDHTGAERAAVARLHAALAEAQAVAPGEFAEIWRREADRHYRRYLEGELTFAGQRLARVKAVFGCLGQSLSDRAAAEVFALYLKEYEASWRAYDDVLPCLQSLSSYRLGAISNGDPVQQRYKLARTGLLPYFLTVVTAGAVGVAKPQAAIFALALRELGITPKEAVCVGDSLENDVLGAQGAGLRPVWLVRNGLQGRPAPQDVLAISTLLELDLEALR